VIHHHHRSHYGFGNTPVSSRAIIALIGTALAVLVLALAAAWAASGSSGTRTPLRLNQPDQQQSQPAAPIDPNQPLLPREQRLNQDKPQERPLFAVPPPIPLS
jgi:hypothetical protein